MMVTEERAMSHEWCYCPFFGGRGLCLPIFVEDLKSVCCRGVGVQGWQEDYKQLSHDNQMKSKFFDYLIVC